MCFCCVSWVVVCSYWLVKCIVFTSKDLAKPPEDIQKISLLPRAQSSNETQKGRKIETCYLTNTVFFLMFFHVSWCHTSLSTTYKLCYKVYLRAL